MSFVYNNAKRGWLAGDFVWGGADVFELIQCMITTSADTENDGIAFVADFGTLGEHGTAGRSNLPDLTPTVVDASDRGEADATDVTYSTLASGASLLQGTVVYKEVATDADRIPMGWFNYPGNIDPGGSDLIIVWNANGLFHIT